MLHQTIVLFTLATFLQATAAIGAWYGFITAGERRWAWLCLLGASLCGGVRNAIPLWIALRVGLYDGRDAWLAIVIAAFFLLAVIGLLGISGGRRNSPPR